MTDSTRHIFDDLDISDTRRKGETYEAYCTRRRKAKHLLKVYLKGAYIWVKGMGTAVRKEP